MSHKHSPRAQFLSNNAKEQLDPGKEAAQDVERARRLLNKYISSCTLHVEESQSSEKIEAVPEALLESYARMIEWVEQLASLLQDAHNDRLESKTALMLAESNLRMALANNEMLEDALKHAGSNVKDIGWRRLSERERLRRTKEEEESDNVLEDLNSLNHKHHLPSSSLSSQTQFMPSQHQPASSLRFFNFSSLSRTTSSLTGTASHASTTAEFPTEATSYPPHTRPSSPVSPRPTARERELSSLLDKEKESLKSVVAAKLALENELEALSQSLFEEANKMVYTSNRKLAEVEEELRTVVEEREALRSALRIVEGENDILREKTSVQETTQDKKISSLHIEDDENSQQDAV